MAERKLYRDDLAELVGIRPNSLQRAKPPEPDGHDLERGHARPWWYESTALAWRDARPGRGWAKGRPQVAAGERRGRAG